MIYLTSFKRSKYLPAEFVCYSAAVYQPNGFHYPKVSAFDIRDKGKWIRPREFVGAREPLKAYHDALYAHYIKREKIVQIWLDKIINDPSVALCCWCPYEKAAQRQLKEWGSFVCHLSVVGEFLHDLGAQVWYDGDRLKMAILWSCLGQSFKANE